MTSSTSPSEITCVLSKLHARPEIVWNLVLNLVALRRFVSVRFMKSVVASAKASAKASDLKILFLPHLLS